MEEGSFGFPRTPVLNEVRIRQRKVQFLQALGSIPLLELIATGHVSRSVLYKPEVSLIMPKDSLVSAEERSNIVERAEETGENQHVLLHVLADGRKAYVKRVE